MTANEMKFNFQLKFDSLFEFNAPAYDDRQISYLLTEAQYRVFIKRYNPMGNKYGKGFEDDEQRRRDLDQLIKSATIVGAGTSGLINYNCSFSSSSNLVTVVSGGDIENTFGLNEGQKIYATGIGSGVTSDQNVIKTVLSDNSFTVESTPSGTGTSASAQSGLGLSSAQGMSHPNGNFYDLPEGFLYAIEEAVVLESDGVVSSKEAWVKPVRHDAYLANINNPYKQPYKDLVWRMDISRQTHAEGTSIAATSKRTEIITDGNGTNGTSELSHYRMRYLSLPPEIRVDEFDDDNQRHCVLEQTLHREIVDEAVVIAQAAAQKDSYQVGLSEQERNE